MCTVREIREAIQENCQSQMDMEMIEIDRIFQIFPFTQEQDIFQNHWFLNCHIRQGKENREADRRNLRNY